MNATTQPTPPHERATSPDTASHELLLPRHLSRLRRACAAFDAVVAEFGNDPAVLSERINELQDALRAFERSELEPDDEHADDYNARLARVTADPAGYLHDVTLDRVVAYVTHCAATGRRGWHGVERCEAESGYRWSCTPGPRVGAFLVGIDAATTARTFLRSVAVAEGRGLVEVLCDVLAPQFDPSRALSGDA